MSANARREFAQLLAGARSALECPDGPDHETRLRLISHLERAESLLDMHVVPWEIAVHIGQIDHRHGAELFAALDRDVLMAQVGAYCRLWWSEIEDKRDPAALDNDMVASIYFSQNQSECLATEIISIPGPESNVAAPVQGGRYLSISTHHVLPSTGDLLDAWAQLPPDQRPLRIADTGYGWFVRTDAGVQVPTAQVPSDLVAALSFARAHGFRYLLLDRDADELDELDHFDW